MPHETQSSIALSLGEVKNLEELDAFFEKNESDISEFLKKLRLMREFKPANGLRVKTYPSGIPSSLLEKLCHQIAKSTPDDDIISVESKGDFVFALVKNGSLVSNKIEREHKRTGGIHSVDVTDFGEFRILQFSSEGNLGKGWDYSLFKVKSHSI